tara:strand:+ start:814 stop:1293 length:480 start_codon:yes stop_codon:yes gene_type:complete
MQNFIENRIKKYVDSWWEPYKENHPHFKHWWENTRDNSTAICPDDLLGFSGISSVYDARQAHKFSKTSIGYKTSTSIIWKAAKSAEKFKLLQPLTYSWCSAAYLAGMTDSFYQQFHQDIHIGTVVGDWYLEQWDSAEHWYVESKNSMHNWWEHDEHWWQ